MEKLTMKQMPRDERPYEKCMEKGPKALSDSELLAVIIRTGNREESALELSRRILSLCGGTNGLEGFSRLTFQELLSLKGVGNVKAVQLLCISELTRRLARTKTRTGRIFTTSRAVAEYYMESMRHESQEHVVLMMLDTRGRLLGEKWMFAGTATASVVSPRELYAEALRSGSTNIILVHNHPSGDPQPSQEDILLTGRVRKCGQMLDISLTDHVIIGDMRYTSFREQGLLD